MFQYQSKKMINQKENIAIKKHIESKPEDEHTHDFIEIEYVFFGEGCQVINGVLYPASRGDIFFLNFGDTHSYYTKTEIGIIDCIINPEFFGSQLIHSDNALDILAVSSLHEFKDSIKQTNLTSKFIGYDMLEVEAIFDAMSRELDQKDIGYMTALKGYINILLIKMFRDFKKSDNNVYPHIKKITSDIILYIENNYNKKISLKELTKDCFYNPSYFSTVFKECYNKTLTEYINEIRIKNAMDMLKNSTESIEKIAANVGYNDKKQFYKQFKAISGVTPKQYRMQI